MDKKKPEPQRWEATFTRTESEYGSGLIMNSHIFINAFFISRSAGMGVIFAIGRHLTGSKQHVKLFFTAGVFFSSLHADCSTKHVKQFRLGIATNRCFMCSVFRGSAQGGSSLLNSEH